MVKAGQWELVKNVTTLDYEINIEQIRSIEIESGLRMIDGYQIILNAINKIGVSGQGAQQLEFIRLSVIVLNERVETIFQNKHLYSGMSQPINVVSIAGYLRKIAS